MYNLEAAMDGLSARREAREREEEIRKTEMREGRTQKNKWGVQYQEFHNFRFSIEDGSIMENHTKTVLGGTRQLRGEDRGTTVVQAATLPNALNAVVQDYRGYVKYLENTLDVVYDSQHEAISVLQQALEKEKADHGATCASLDALINRVEVLQKEQTAQRIQLEGQQSGQKQICSCFPFL